MSSRKYRQKAAEKFNKQSNMIVVCYLIIFAVSAILAPTGVGILLISGPIALSLAHIADKLTKEEKVEFEDLLLGFKNFVSTIVLFLLKTAFVVLWSLLFVIPGLVKSYAYSMAFYLLKDNPQLQAQDALKESEKLMKGHKLDLFKLHFSYIGWLILSALTFGILFLWVKPKMDLATYEFYLNLKKDSDIIDFTTK